MDPAHSRATLPGLPRTRGDGPMADGTPGCGFPAHAGMDPVVDRRQASPHTRGWTRPSIERCGMRAGFPAHAGMDPSSAPLSVPSGLPRTRGDGPGRIASVGFPAHAGPNCRDTAVRVGVASPHTRGWTLGRTSRHHTTSGRLPRTRGDGPATCCEGQPLLPRGFPAHAGMDPLSGRSRLAGWRLPRTRGDGPLV